MDLSATPPSTLPPTWMARNTSIPNGRTIGQVPLEEWVGPGVIADISELVSNSSVYTPAMIERVVDIHEGDILIIKTGWSKYGWISEDSDEFRYMIKHPGPSPDFAEWAA